MPQPKIEMYIQRESYRAGCLRQANVTRGAIALIALLVAILPIAVPPGVALFPNSDLG
jgi:hypothetical protein